MALWCAYGVELVVLVAVAGSLELSSTPVLPALSALAGLGGAALLTRPRSPRQVRFETIATVASGAAVLVLAILLVWTAREPLFNGGRAATFTAAGALAAIALSTAGAAWLVSGDAERRFGRRAGLVFLSVLLVSEGLAAARAIRHDLLAHRTGVRALSDQVAPELLPLSPASSPSARPSRRRSRSVSSGPAGPGPTGPRWSRSPRRRAAARRSSGRGARGRPTRSPRRRRS